MYDLVPQNDLIAKVEVIHSHEQHCPVILLLDTSGSMSFPNESPQINQLNKALEEFKKEIEKDDLAKKRIDLAIVTFGCNDIQISQNFTTIDHFTPVKYKAGGATPMGNAIYTAIELVENRKKHYQEEGTDYFRPWIFLITDGAPTDMEEGSAKWYEIINKVHNGEKNKKFSFYAIGVDNADMSKLNKISPPTRTALKLKESKWLEMFHWLSRSLVATSTPENYQEGQQPLESPLGWGYAQR